MQVRFNDFRRQWQEIGPEALRAVGRVGQSGWYVLGKEVERFESLLARAWGAAHCIGVGTGLDAIEISLRCLGVAETDRVLTTPLSAFATTLAILRVGATPVFTDVDERGLIDLDRCRDAFARDSGIRVFLPVHLYGHPLDLQVLAELRDRFELRIVEDSAQAIGASFCGLRAGTVGQLAATSFYPTKNLGALGDGGAVLTVSGELAELARSLRDYGQSARYVHDHVGMNSRLDEIHAAVLADAMLARLPEWTASRRRIAQRYLTGIHNPHIKVLRPLEGSQPVWHLFPVVVSAAGRESLIRHLGEHGVMTGRHYPKLIPEQGALVAYGRFEVLGDLANSRRFADGEVSLPIHPHLTDAEVDRVIDACNGWREE